MKLSLLYHGIYSGLYVISLQYAEEGYTIEGNITPASVTPTLSTMQLPYLLPSGMQIPYFQSPYTNFTIPENLALDYGVTESITASDWITDVLSKDIDELLAKIFSLRVFGFYRPFDDPPSSHAQAIAPECEEFDEYPYPLWFPPDWGDEEAWNATHKWVAGRDPWQGGFCDPGWMGVLNNYPPGPSELLEEGYQPMFEVICAPSSCKDPNYTYSIAGLYYPDYWAGYSNFACTYDEYWSGPPDWGAGDGNRLHYSWPICSDIPTGEIFQPYRAVYEILGLPFFGASSNHQECISIHYMYPSAPIEFVGTPYVRPDYPDVMLPIIAGASLLSLITPDFATLVERIIRLTPKPKDAALGYGSHAIGYSGGALGMRGI